MNKNFNVITINGIRGIITAIFIVFGLISGFIISPAWVCMHIWNNIAQNLPYAVFMNIYEGIMLWAIIALSLYALNNKHALIGFGSFKGLSPEQIQEITAGAKFSETNLIKHIEQLKTKELNKEIEKEQKNQIILDEDKDEAKK